MNRHQQFHKSVPIPKGTTEHSQQQNKVDVVSIKDCLSSDLTSFETSSRDVAAGLTGVHESEALSCYSSVSTSVGAQSKTVEVSAISKNYPNSPGLMKPNSLKSTHRNDSLTSTISKTVEGSAISKNYPNSYGLMKPNSLKSTHRNDSLTSKISKTVEGSAISKNYPNSPGLMKPNSLKSTHRNDSLTSTISKTVEGSAISKNYPNSYGLMKPNSLESTHRNDSLTSKISKTVEGSAISKNYPNSPGLMKPNSLKFTHRNDSLTSTISKTVVDPREDIKILNKAPHSRSNFTAAPPPNTYRQVGKFSSLANPRCHVFSPTNYRPNTSTNYRPNGRVSSVNDQFSPSDKFRSGESEMSTEMTRGPRGRYNHFLLPSTAIKDELAITICRDQYNLSDFQTTYETAKFYVIKSFNEDDVHKGVKYNVWTSTPNGNKKLNAAFLDAEAKLRQTGTMCPVFLFFSVNGSRQFVGVAEMLGPVDFKKDMNFWKLDKYKWSFPIKWHIIKDVPNNQFRHIILPSNENKPVTFTRDTQEIGFKEGLEMLNIFKSYSAETSLLDDFVFYEKREKLFSSQRSTKHARPEQELYGNDNYQNTDRAREKKIDMQSNGTKQVNLVKLTENLSLSSSGKQGFR